MTAVPHGLRPRLHGGRAGGGDSRHHLGLRPLLVQPPVPGGRSPRARQPTGSVEASRSISRTPRHRRSVTPTFAVYLIAPAIGIGSLCCNYCNFAAVPRLVRRPVLRGRPDVLPQVPGRGQPRSSALPRDLRQGWPGLLQPALSRRRPRCALQPLSGPRSAAGSTSTTTRAPIAATARGSARPGPSTPPSEPPSTSCPACRAGCARTSASPGRSTMANRRACIVAGRRGRLGGAVGLPAVLRLFGVRRARRASPASAPAVPRRRP